MSANTNNPGPAEQDGSAKKKSGPPPRPDVSADRAVPSRPGAPSRTPLPIEEIEEEEDDAKGG